MIIGLTRRVRSPARAELPHYRRDTQLQQMPYNGIIYKDYTDITEPRYGHQRLPGTTA